MYSSLRIGVFRGGKLVDDRYVSEGTDVTVGTAPGSFFSLKQAGLPKELLLFKVSGQGVSLNLVEGLRGELSLEGQSREPLSQLQGKALRGADGVFLPLSASSRGWVALGETTFFFQFAQKPPPPPPRELPKEAQAGLLSGLEVIFVGILAAVLAVEGVAIFAIHQRPDTIKDAPAAPENLDRFMEILMPELPKEEPPPPEEDKKAEEDAAKQAAEDAAKQAEEPKKTEEPKEAPKESSPEKKAEIREAVAKTGLLTVIGSVGAGGAVANVFGQSQGFSDDISAALAGAGGVTVATGDGSTIRREGSGAEKVGIGGLEGAVSGSGGQVQMTERKRSPPQISFDNSEMIADSSSVDKATLARFIRMRIKGVQQCYEKELKRNPALQGKIVVRFYITTEGRVSDVSIDEDTMGDTVVSGCIVNLIRRWSFPMKPEEDSPVSFPFVFSPG